MERVLPVVMASALFVLGASATALAEPQRVVVRVGESIQKVIDAAEVGTIIEIEAGTFDERISITKSVTIKGAGWDKTILKPTTPTEAEILAARSEQQQTTIAAATQPNARAARRPVATIPPTITIESAQNVVISDLQIGGPTSLAEPGRVWGDVLFSVKQAGATIERCAIVGPFDNGVQVTDRSNVIIKQTLVAGMLNIGITVQSGVYANSDSMLKLIDSDVRNCYHRGIVIGCDDVEIRGCRISGSAWHGIRYDKVSPTIENNRIFGNARCGIYASGKTAAAIRNNVFYANEMDGISCWFKNADTIEANTFVSNLREGVSVLGGSRPTLRKNVFATNVNAISCNAIGGEDPTVFGDPILEGNHFRDDQVKLLRGKDAVDLPAGNLVTVIDFVSESMGDYTLRDRTTAGASDSIAAVSPWPIQPGELAIIPDGPSRDYRQWKLQEK